MERKASPSGVLPLPSPPRRRGDRTRTYARVHIRVHGSRDRGASPLRKRRAVGQPVHPVYLSPSFAPRRAVRFLRYVQSVREPVLVARGRATQYVAGRRRQTDTGGRGEEGEKETVGRSQRPVAREEKRRDQKRSEEKRRGEKGRKRERKGKATRHRPRTALHATPPCRTRTDHASRVSEREREKRGKDRVPRWRVDGRHSRSSPMYVGGAAAPGSLDRATARRPGDPVAGPAGPPGLPNLNSIFCQWTPNGALE